MAADFAKQWAEGKIDGWKDESLENGHVNAPMDLDFYDTVEELVAIGGRQIEGGKGILHIFWVPYSISLFPPFNF